MHYANTRITIHGALLALTECGSILFSISGPAGVQNHNTETRALGFGGGCGCCRIHYARAPCAPPPPPPGWIFSSLSPKQIYDASPADSRRQLGLSRADRGRRTNAHSLVLSARRAKIKRKLQNISCHWTHKRRGCLISFHIKAYCARSFARSGRLPSLHNSSSSPPCAFLQQRRNFLGLSHESYSIFYADNSVGQRAGCWLGGAAR